ncbi:MAG: EAL domain-containing protein [Gammaproteobacteria bacterium]
MKRFTNKPSPSPVYERNETCQKIKSLLVYQELQHIQTKEDDTVPLAYLIDYLNDQISQSELRILPDRPLALRDGHVMGRFATLQLSSVFQRVVSSRDTACSIGHEGLLRVHTVDGRAVAPWAALRGPVSPNAIVYLDRLCRMVHMLNYLAQMRARPATLFLNVGTRHLLSVSQNHGWYFEQVLQDCGLMPQHIVIDVRASDTYSSRAHAALANYRARGYRVAIEDFALTDGAFELLWQMPADIVKLDVRSLIKADKSQRRKLRRLLEHTPIDVIATGVETSEQARAARALGIAGLQGFYFGTPAASVSPLEKPRELTRKDLEASVLCRDPPFADQGARLQFCC